MYLYWFMDMTEGLKFGVTDPLICIGFINVVTGLKVIHCRNWGRVFLRIAFPQTMIWSTIGGLFNILFSFSVCVLQMYIYNYSCIVCPN